MKSFTSKESSSLQGLSFILKVIHKKFLAGGDIRIEGSLKGKIVNLPHFSSWLDDDKNYGLSGDPKIESNRFLARENNVRTPDTSKENLQEPINDP